MVLVRSQNRDKDKVIGLADGNLQAACELVGFASDLLSQASS